MNNKIQKSQRKRGRPAGRDRVPLSQEERRARNAQYERERRNEHAQAVSELVQASGLDSGMSFENLIRHVCCYFQVESRRGTDESVEYLRQKNTDLWKKIKEAEARLAIPTPPQSPNDEEGTCMRTRPFNYIRKVKKERTIESSPTTIQPIETEVYEDNINYSMDEHFKSEHTTELPSCSKNQSRFDHPSTSQETEQRRRSQDTKTKKDPYILGLFTEEEAKNEIVQYYINLLKGEGYTGVVDFEMIRSTKC